MIEQHAFCAPSDWSGWSNCPGKPALEEEEPDISSPDADFGTRAHEWAATILRSRATELPEAVPADMRAGVQCYIEAVYARKVRYEQTGWKVTLLIEQRLDISVVTGERDARGTADVVLIATHPEHKAVLEIVDLKFGVGVPVSPVGNGQLMIYALAALVQHMLLVEFAEVILTIHQPRIRPEPQEWHLSVDELLVFGQKATEAAALALSLRGDVAALSHLNPGEVQCRFCRVKHRCPALKQFVQSKVLDELTQVQDPKSVATLVQARVLAPDKAKVAQWLSQGMLAIPLIEAWCLAVRATVDKALLAGESIPGFKLVTGRKGNRAWTDADAVAMLLLGNGFPRQKLFPPATLLSPAQLETLLKDTPVWAQLTNPDAPMIRQADGKPSVAPESDPRPAWCPDVLADFQAEEPQNIEHFRS